ncbi:hypothetical protein [Streptomyces sp. NPDC018693]|uniref:hypothetical protein n=1 Tax=unclassified Streptomyces TaxID=2593676 RepID=UPI003793E020
MPRGRHRHSPPLHRLLPPSAIAGVSLVCAFGPWVVSEPGVLRVVAAVAAATAVVGAAVMRRWDTQAGKQVADLTRARASDEWRFEERVAELEADLDESRELRGKLEQRLRAKRAELQGLRNEHAALLRRYATAETERASALEGRRLLEIEATTPVRELPPVPADARDEAEAVAADADFDADGKPTIPGAFSPEGSKLFLRAQEALNRLGGGGGGPAPEKAASAAEKAAAEETAVKETAVQDEAAQDAAAREDEAEGQPEAVDEHTRAAATHPDSEEGDGTAPAQSAPSEEPVTRAEAERAELTPATTSTAVVPRPAGPLERPAGHFTVPTAVAVVPAAQPVRRPAAEGSFDFFGTKKTPESDALDAVQNEDLADVVGQEALALHKAETEAGYKPAGADARVVGQVIDLTAHDETEQIDVQRLRSAAS